MVQLWVTAGNTCHGSILRTYAIFTSKLLRISSLKGAYNAVAPEHVTNREFMRTLATVLGKPFFFPAVPSFAMKILFGKMSGILLNGSRVSADKIISAGYNFEFPDLENALKNLFPKR